MREVLPVCGAPTIPPVCTHHCKVGCFVLFTTTGTKYMSKGVVPCFSLVAIAVLVLGMQQVTYKDRKTR